MKLKILFTLSLSLITLIAQAAGWQPLPSGYFIPAKMPMTVVFPRPDSETNTWSRQRLAYADGTVQYRIPVSIQGGAYPFHYELLSGPQGMAIGKDINNTDYGIVTWTPSASDINNTPYPVSVKVTDQQLNTVTISWSVKATTSGFIFVDPNAPAGGNGTKAQPFNSTASIFTTVPATNPYAHDIIYFRGGTTILTAPYADGTIKFADNTNSPVWLGYPGENVTLDFSHSQVTVDNQDDVFIGGLHIINPNPKGYPTAGAYDARFFFFSTFAAEDRITFFENKFENIHELSGGDPNQAAVVLYNPTVLRNYFTMIGNSMNNYSAPMLDSYAIKYGVIENNSFLQQSSTSWAGLYLKSDLQNISVRRNTALSGTFSSGFVDIPLQAQYYTNANIEIAYNVGLTDSGPAVRLEWIGANQPKNSNPQIYMYRNTFRGEISGMNDFAYTVNLESNVLINSTSSVADFSMTTASYRLIIQSNNLFGTTASDYIDQDGNLIGSNASPLRGKVGHEITYGVNPLSAPIWQ